MRVHHRNFSHFKFLISFPWHYISELFDFRHEILGIKLRSFDFIEVENVVSESLEDHCELFILFIQNIGEEAPDFAPGIVDADFLRVNLDFLVILICRNLGSDDSLVAAHPEGAIAEKEKLEHFFFFLQV